MTDEMGSLHPLPGNSADPALLREMIFRQARDEDVDGEIKRRTEVLGIFSNDEAVPRLVGTVLLEQNDEWAVRCSRYMPLECITPIGDDPLVGVPARVA